MKSVKKSIEPKLIPIKYNSRKYPTGIIPDIIETPAHFDSQAVNRLNQLCSLHTEYSYGERKLNSPALNGLDIIKKSHLNNIPQLWKDPDWAGEFVVFIQKITCNITNKSLIKIIEIHPPFVDYCPTVNDFIETYTKFEQNIIQHFPDVEILLENRNGSRYPSKFLISNTNDLLCLASIINKNNLRLRLVIDLPQLLSSYKPRKSITAQDISNVIRPLVSIKDIIKGIHIWGAKGTQQHHGDLNDLFNNNQILKKRFLDELKNLFNDEIERYFVPEVNSNDRDLGSIVTDFINTGFVFK